MDDYQKFAELILNLPRRASTRVWHNMECLKCHTVEREMVSIGAYCGIVMCNKCAQEEFSSTDPVREEREKYLYWLEIYKKSAGA